MSESTTQPVYEDVLMARYESLLEDQTQLYHYFTINDQYINRISPPDMREIKARYEKYHERLSKAVGFTIAGTLLVDKLVLPKVAPQFHFPGMRLPVWGFKYLVLPFAAFGVTKSYFSRDLEQRLHAIMGKYQYTFEDFKKINYAIEREIEVRQNEANRRRK